MSGSRGRAADRYLLLGATLFLTLFGLVMIYSASSAADIVGQHDAAYHMKKQLLYLVLGYVALVGFSWIDYRKLRRAGWPLWGASLLGLAAVHFVGVGKWGAQRWLIIGPVPVQPSEYAKLGTLLVVASLLADWKRRRLDGKELLIRLVVAVVPIVLFVMLQPDMGTTVAIVIGVYLLLWMARVSWVYLGEMAAVGSGLAVAAVAAASYRLQRFLAFLHPWRDPLGSGYQIIQSTLAFGSGGLLGVGLGMSRQKFFYLPAAHTDFIFAIIGEELGLIGTLAVVLAFAVFAYAGLRIAMSASDHYGRLLAGGLTAIVTTQAVINMASVTGLMPITGIPLPLVSYGGSSLTLIMACIGMIVSVQRHGGQLSRAKRGGGKPKPEEELEGAFPFERRGHGRPRLSSVDGGRGAARRRA